MQVSSVNDHITHAVIGGGDTFEFGISSSAEFFNILSSTLYTNQPLAVVREVLCNAWDAHIASGRTNLPVEVTVQDRKLIVKDHGFGIRHEDMGQIYGTYGNSTKANDGKQTGGFGLGCKAPFAYTDHFEVISNNGGFKSIYALSKSSAKAVGKPSIITIAKFPSQDTGLTVTINLKSDADTITFKSLVKNIAYGGDMNVLINGVKEDTIGFPADDNFLVTNFRRITAGDDSTHIFVRYGNVIYPVKSAEEIAGPYAAVLNALDKVRHYRLPPLIIFQAPPHSISVTPSREHLSMQEKTIDTLKKLFDSFLQRMGNSFEDHRKEVAQETNELAFKKKLYNTFFDIRWDYAGPVKTDFVSPDTSRWATNRFEHLSRLSLAKGYPESAEFFSKDVKSRAEILLTQPGADKSLIRSFIAEVVATTGYTKTPRPFTNDWFKKHITAPLIKKLMRAQSETISHSRLYVFATENGFKKLSSHRYDNTPECIPVVKASPAYVTHSLPFLRKILILSTAKNDFTERALLHPVLKEYGEVRNALLYQVSRKKGADEEARKFFQNSGYTVVDLTVPLPGEKIVKRDPPPRKKALPGYPSLENLIPSRYWDISVFDRPDTKRTLTPEFYIPYAKSDGFNKTCPSEILKKLFAGHKELGCVAVGIRQTKKLEEAGVKTFDIWLRDRVIKSLENNQNVRDYFANNSHKAEEFDESGNWREIRALWQCPSVLSHYGITVPTLTDEETDNLYFLQHFLSNRSTTKVEAHKLRGEFDAIPLSPPCVALLKKIENSEVFSLLNMDTVKDFLESPNQAKKDSTLKILLSVLN